MAVSLKNTVPDFGVCKVGSSLNTENCKETRSCCANIRTTIKGEPLSPAVTLCLPDMTIPGGTIKCESAC